MSEYFYNDSELQIDTTFILCIEELDETNSYSPIDTRLFIGWDESTNDFYIRGRRQDIRKSDFVPFAFRCNSSHELYDFIKFTMSNRVNVILYNFNNTDGMTTDEVSYEFFESHIDKNYEISGYNDIKLNRFHIVKYLRILQNTYNWEIKDEKKAI